MLSLSEFCDRYWLNFTEFLISFKEKYVDVGKEIFYEISMSYLENFGSWKKLTKNCMKNECIYAYITINKLEYKLFFPLQRTDICANHD